MSGASVSGVSGGVSGARVSGGVSGASVSGVSGGVSGVSVSGVSGGVSGVSVSGVSGGVSGASVSGGVSGADDSGRDVGLTTSKDQGEDKIKNGNVVVAYFVDGKILAVGKVHQQRSFLHGHRIAPSFVCVLVTYVDSDKVQAPIILGDPVENGFIQKGMFFALPISNLYTYVNYVPGEKVVLRKYTCP